ncbi:flagellar hook-associated protein FlgK [Desulfovibrio sp. OttesenSCG-928-I05]|nr:flagellar hook-associated protein FlgK [Desulfovibrio sp. OttesenSCG-928-I05]
MASSVNSILNMGAGALFANQTAIQTTGNNISNVNTLGYSRQIVRFEEYPSLDFRPGQMGQGVRAAEVYRMFNSFVERNYLHQSGMESRWNEQLELLETVESLFNESNSVGISSNLSAFFNAWHDLSGDGSSTSNRAALLATAETLAGFIRETEGSMAALQSQIDGIIKTNVDEANTLISEIAELNRQIAIHHEKGVNNANTLMDQRDLRVRQLAEIIDIDVIDRGGGNYKVSTRAGMSLVEDGVSYSLEFHGPQTEKKLITRPVPGVDEYTGDIKYTGSDESEYTIEIVSNGTVADSSAVPPPAGTAMYRVSLDGGRTWMKDEAGNDLLFPARTDKYSEEVKDLGISFEDSGTLLAGDRFTIVPKSGVYWNSPTTGLINITPQTFANGEENSRRLTGGKMAADFLFRDTQLGEYREKVDSFAKALIWEVNRIHSQGVGLSKSTYMLGDYKVDLPTGVPLASSMSGLDFWDKLQDGNFSMAIYDQKTGEPVLLPNGSEAACNINFVKGSEGPPPVTGDSLQDVCDKINASAIGPYVTASINTDGRLEISSKDPESHSFAFGDDTSGLLAGLGLNTFFKGSGSGDIAITDRVANDLNMINAGKVNGAGEGNAGDQETARELANLSEKQVQIGTKGGATTTQTIGDFYGSIVTKVGADTRNAKYQTAFYGAVAQDLRDTQDANSGVNLDEEMTNLVKFQNSYKAAAKLITTADQMLQTVIGLKQ